MSKSEIEEFCKSLKGNKVKNSQELFTAFPRHIQNFFLENAWNILAGKVRGEEIGDEESYVTAFRLFKLFRSKEMKNLEAYKIYSNRSNLERYYAAAKKNADSEKSASKSSSSKSASSRGSKSTSPKTPRSTSAKYDKEYQRYATPSEGDPLVIFYESLYKEKPSSALAITWLTERGVAVEDRDKLVEKYKKLAEKGKLIR